jgi:4-hydroxy-4-methyl-2-oxoglutarate aldolase
MPTDLLARLANIGTTALCDADPSIQVLTGLAPVRPDTRMVGPARTVACGGDLLPVLRGLDKAQPGEVLVIDAAGANLAVAGELFATEATRRGLAGLVVNGCVRDLTTLRSLDRLAVYSTGVCPAAGNAVDMGQLQVDVTCGGVTISPGDILVGDPDGLVVASAERLQHCVATAEWIQAGEDRIRDAVAGGRSLLEMSNYTEHVAAVAAGKPSRFRLLPPD